VFVPPAIHAEALLRAAEAAAVEMGRARDGYVQARQAFAVSRHKAKLPPLKKWDGKCPGRKADTFLDDVELYADHDMQDRQLSLQTYLEGMVREGWEMVKRRWNGVVPPWAEIRVQFKRMVGQQYDVSGDVVRRELVDHKITQKSGQSVTDFRVEFESKLVYVTDISEPMAAAYFVTGLRPALKALCQTDATGKAFATLNDAAEFAVGKERELALHPGGRVSYVQEARGYNNRTGARGGDGSGGGYSGAPRPGGGYTGAPRYSGGYGGGARAGGGGYNGNPARARGAYRPPPPLTGKKRTFGGGPPPKAPVFPCFVCGSLAHRASECPRRHGGPGAGAGGAAQALGV
jgi:hypothetical protein